MAIAKTRVPVKIVMDVVMRRGSVLPLAKKVVRKMGSPGNSAWNAHMASIVNTVFVRLRFVIKQIAKRGAAIAMEIVFRDRVRCNAVKVAQAASVVPTGRNVSTKPAKIPYVIVRFVLRAAVMKKVIA